VKDPKDVKKSVYRSAKGTAKNKTVVIAVDDPRAAKNKLGQTIARQGSEVQVVGLDGVLLSSGGTKPTNAGGGSGNVPDPGYQKGITFPSINGQPPYEGPGAIVLADITNISTAWSTEVGRTEDLIITFDWDYDDPANRSVTEFVVEVTVDGVARRTKFGTFSVNRTQTAQTLNFTREINETTIGTFRTNITSVCVFAIDAFFNSSTNVCDTTVPVYVLDLPVPVITVAAAIGGYNVSYTIPTQGVFDAIDIVEYESNASTEPTGVSYSRVYFSSISPANIITLNSNPRWVKARFSSDGGEYTAFSAAQKITPTAPVAVDTTGPVAPSTGSVTPGIDNSTGATVGFNAYVDISWSAVSDTTLRGYRIRFRENGTSNPFSYVDSPGPGTSFRLNGLSIGTVYAVEIASYDQFNNTSSSYFSIGTAQATGTPFIGKNVTTVGYFGASAAGDTGTFKFGYGVQDSGGVKRGLVFNASNYWYIDSSQSALFKLGGDANNYIQWDGQDFNVAGNITARGGSFTGNVLLNGGSLYAIGTGGSASSGIRTIFNSSGIAAYNASGGYTTMLTTPLADGTVFVTTAANIGGWTVNASKISKTQANQGTISLDSTNGYISISNDGIANKTSGINSPSLTTDVVFWSGANATDGVTSDIQRTAAPFRVNLSGDMFASNAEIKGTIRATDGGFGIFDGDTLTSGWTIGKVSAGVPGSSIVAVGAGGIRLGDYSLQTVTSGGTDFQIYDVSSGTSILKTETYPGATADPKRIFLGDVTRNV
jgi:hypothetical protein